MVSVVVDLVFKKYLVTCLLVNAIESLIEICTVPYMPLSLFETNIKYSEVALSRRYYVR